jgi:30S ribosomal protein S31
MCGTFLPKNGRESHVEMRDCGDVRPEPAITRPLPAIVRAGSIRTGSPGRELVGKGDKRSRRGKIYKGSYGNARPHRLKKATRIAKPVPTGGKK